METCLVCYKEINKVRDCGLELLCGHWHCEKCTNILAEHCSICDRSTLNKQFPCRMCGNSIKMFQSRVCQSCENLCCTNCGTKDYCCFWPEFNEHCDHVVCSNC